MVKARFSESQQPVKIIENGDMVTVFICLNGVEKTDENAFEESLTSYIEYDYNEFVEEKSLLDMDDLNSNPENYLNYIVNPELDKLKNEKIDIVKWSEDPAEFIAASLSPAKVISAEINEEEKSAHVVVPEYQLSLAIGRAGQNVRLAARLTGWKIDISAED